VQHAKAHVQSLPKQAMLQYTMLLMAPTIVTLLTGIGGRTRPMFNVTISNVPGPEKPLYFRGARLEAIYPASIVTHGQALNITLSNNADNLDFGLVGCRRSVPSLQRLLGHLEDSLSELEQAVGTAGGKPAATRRRKAAAPSAKRATDS
jgi:hypothetical protein